MWELPKDMPLPFSGGMAKDGLLPFCNIYSSFMQRAYDNVIHDIAIQKLNVVLCLDRAGLVGEDGPYSSRSIRSGLYETDTQSHCGLPLQRT